MKQFSTIGLIGTSCILLTAMAFSCQDHHVPDPVTNCNRTDGSFRTFNCEFEFVKADFYRLEDRSWPDMRQDTVVEASITPVSNIVTMKEPWLAAWIVSSRSMTYARITSTRVTIRRIAPSASKSNMYLLRYNFAGFGNTEGSTFGSTLPNDESLKPVKIDIPVGGTYTYFVPYQWFGTASDKGKYIDYHLTSDYYFLVQNVKTSELLRQAPYNYNLYRDLAEAKFKFRVNVIPFVIP